MDAILAFDTSAIARDGFVRLRYPANLRRGVELAIKNWEGFCQLSRETKGLVVYSGDTNVSGVGYELKLEGGGTNDLKEDFHLRSAERHLIEANLRKAGPVAVAFMESAFALQELMEPLILGFAHSLEEQYELPGFSADVATRLPRSLIRFLHYFGDREAGDYLASPHVDKGGFTLHLYESHAGLEHLTYAGAWEPMDFSAAETAIIPALRLQLRSENRLKATCHRVVAGEETARIGRFSAVCFVDFVGTPYYDKKRRGRLQDQPIGFNYQVPLGEFREFFEEVST